MLMLNVVIVKYTVLSVFFSCSDQRKHCIQMSALKKGLRCENRLKDIVVGIQRVYSLPILCNIVTCFVEILDLLYFIAVSEFSLKMSVNSFFWLIFLTLKVFLILRSSEFALKKVSLSHFDGVF